MRQSLVSMAVLLLLYAALIAAQQNTLDSVVKQTKPLITENTSSRYGLRL